MNSLRAYLPSGSRRIFENLDIQISGRASALARLLSEGCGTINHAASTRDGLVPIGEVSSGPGDPVEAIHSAAPQARRGFTLADQVNQLVGASEADPERGFMARMMVLCSLPRSNPGNRHQYKRVNGPYKLIMIAGGDNKLPFGNLPRLLLAWVCTEAVRTQSRELVLGRSLSEFMRTLGINSTSGGVRGEQTRLRKQIRRLFGLHRSTNVQRRTGRSCCKLADRPAHRVLVERAQAQPSSAVGPVCAVPCAGPGAKTFPSEALTRTSTLSTPEAFQETHVWPTLPSQT